jgi:hypothetical protein
MATGAPLTTFLPQSTSGASFDSSPQTSMLGSLLCAVCPPRSRNLLAAAAALASRCREVVMRVPSRPPATRVDPHVAWRVVNRRDWLLIGRQICPDVARWCVFRSVAVEAPVNRRPYRNLPIKPTHRPFRSEPGHLERSQTRTAHGGPGAGRGVRQQPARSGQSRWSAFGKGSGTAIPTDGGHDPTTAR